MSFGKKLQNYLDEKEISIAEAARLTGLSDSTIRSIIKRNSETIGVVVGIKLAHGLGISTDVINGWCGAATLPADEQEARAMVAQESKELLANINLLSPEDAAQVRGLIQHLAQRGRDQVVRKPKDRP
jgi:transcriptional regulator with XRE-family HTH domain